MILRKTKFTARKLTQYLENWQKKEKRRGEEWLSICLSLSIQKYLGKQKFGEGKVFFINAFQLIREWGTSSFPSPGRINGSEQSLSMTAEHHEKQASRYSVPPGGSTEHRPLATSCQKSRSWHWSEASRSSHRLTGNTGDKGTQWMALWGAKGKIQTWGNSPRHMTLIIQSKTKRNKTSVL